MTDTRNRREALVLGGLVADAASMGFHWLYDPNRIRDVAPTTPEFHAPNPADYEGVPGFFAHGKRTVGDQSQYGEQALVMLRALVPLKGYDRLTYQKLFREHFGYGGDYVGYIDHPTRDTLDKMTEMERDTLVQCRQIDPSVDDRTHHMMITKVMAHLAKHTGDALRVEIEGAVRATHDSDHLVAYALQFADLILANTGFPGADDVQLPALSKIPALVAVHYDDPNLQNIVEDAVRVTNNANLAVEFGQLAAKLLQSCVVTGALPDLDQLVQAASPAVKQAIQPALARRQDSTQAVTFDIGMTCNLDLGVPSVFHNLATSSDYTDAVRKNIYAGGDSCGRSVALGAAMAAIHVGDAAHGLPDDWVKRLSTKAIADDALHALLPS